MGETMQVVFGYLKQKFTGTGTIWFFILVLMGLSILEIYAISGANTYVSGDSDVFFINRIKHVAAAVIFIAVLQLLPVYRVLRSEFWLMAGYFLALMLQVGMIFFGTDDSAGGESKRSIFGFQPTEFNIIITLLYSVFLMQKNQKVMSEINYMPVKNIFQWLAHKFDTKVLKNEPSKKERMRILERKRASYIYLHYALPMALPMLLMFFAVVLGGNLSQGLTMAIVWLVTAFVAGLPFWRHVKVIIVVFVAAVIIIYGVDRMSGGKFRTGTWTSRIDNYVNNIAGPMPDINARDYRLTQENMAEMAIALGQKPATLTGGSIQRSLLQQSYTDYIFAVIVERYSAIGAVILFVLYTSLFYRFRGIARKMKSNYDAMVIYTLGFLILFQMVIHVYVNIGLIPSTGLTLPFISKGGSSLLAVSLCAGIILSYNRADRIIPVYMEADEFIEKSIDATDRRLQERAEESLEADIQAIENIDIYEESDT